VLLLGGAALAIYQWRAHGTPTSPSVAVLPLVNLNADTALDYYVEGITDELINSLARVGGLRVPARTSSFAVQETLHDFPAIGARLGVAYVLEGGLRQTSSDVQITVQLRNVADGQRLWAATYRSDRADIFSAEDQIARVVAAALAGHSERVPTATVARMPTTNPDAHDSYLRGMYFYRQRSPAAAIQAIADFQRAIALDPRYALAYSGLSDSYAHLAASGSAPDAFAQADSAARRAVALDSTLAEGYTSLARILMAYEWDWAGAERAMQRALQLDPQYAWAHGMYGMLLTVVKGARGGGEQGLREAGVALDLDPLNGSLSALYCHALYVRRQYGAAVTACKQTVELVPDWAAAHMHLAFAYFFNGQFDQAAVQVDSAHRLLPASLPPLAFRAYMEAQKGGRDTALQLLGEVQKHVGNRTYWESMALIYVGLGDHDRALAAMDSEFVQRADWSGWGLDPGTPVWDPVRSDPRFGAILRKAGLAP